jgi:hypothetical protein
MDSAYVQRASLSQGPEAARHRVSFTNISSQQRTPGVLMNFHESQVKSTRPMAFDHNMIPRPEEQIAHYLSEERNKVSSVLADDFKNLEGYFGRNTQSTKAEYRTISQQTWGVPLSQVESRATEMF